MLWFAWKKKQHRLDGSGMEETWKTIHAHVSGCSWHVVQEGNSKPVRDKEEERRHVLNAIVEVSVEGSIGMFHVHSVG